MTREQMERHYCPLESRLIRYLNDGDEVIVEQHHWSNGAPSESEWVRTYAGHHMTVSGNAIDLHNEPTLFFPAIPKWSMPWIYAQNNEMITLWVHHSLLAKLETRREG